MEQAHVYPLLPLVKRGGDMAPKPQSDTWQLHAAGCAAKTYRRDVQLSLRWAAYHAV